MNDAFQMREQHQELLERSKSYLIHNLCPTEAFWNALLSMDILEPDMLNDLKSHQSRSEKVTALVDILPHRGPEAFDGFLVALLKCGHGFVADYLKILEAADQFKKDIHNFNISEPVQERLVKTFKRSIPNIQRFFETKLEVNVQEQELEFHEKEKEIDDLQEQVKCLEEEIIEMKSWFKTAVQRCTDLGVELQRQYISRSMLREERKHLEEIYEKAASQEKHEKLMSDFHDGMHAILDYVEMAEDRASQLEHAINCAEEKEEYGQYGGSSGKTITAKVQSVMDLIANVLEKAVAVVKPEEENDVRNELERSIGRLKDIIKDLRHVKQIFLLTLRKKEDLSQETLSLVNNFREIRRLEQEMNEQEKHVQDLKKRGQVIKIKSKRHKRQQEQIQESIDQKEKTLTTLHESLQKQVSSADQRVHFILSLLPDTAEDEEGATEAKTEKPWVPFSRGGTSFTIYPDRSDSRYSLRSDVNDELVAPSTGRSSIPEKTNSHQHCASAKTPSPPTPAKKETTIRKSSAENKVTPDSKERAPLSAREKSVTPISRPNTSVRGKSAGKGIAVAEKVSRETISAAQKRLPPTSPPVSARVLPRKDPVRPTKSNELMAKPTEAAIIKEVKSKPSEPPERPPEKPPGRPPEKPPQLDKNRKEPVEALRSDSAKYRPSTPDDQKDEKQEKNEMSRKIIQVKPAEEEDTVKQEEVASEELLPPKPNHAVLTRQLTQSKTNTSDKSTPRHKYTEPKGLAKGGPLSISSAKTVTHPPMQTPSAKASIGFDKSYSRPTVSASKAKPIQTQHANLKVDSQIMSRERTSGRALRALRMNSVNTEDRDAQSPNMSARGNGNVLDRDSLSQSWMVKSAMPSKPPQPEPETTSITPSSTYPPGKKARNKVDPNRLGSNLDNVLKESKPESFYGRVTDAINKVKRMEPSSTSPSIQQGSQSNVFNFHESSQQRLSLSTESSGAPNAENLASGSAVSDDNLSLSKTWEMPGFSGARAHSLSIDGDFDESHTTGQRVSSSTSRAAQYKPQ